MNRRDAISRVALIMGGAVIGAEFFISGCKSTSNRTEDLFNQDHIAYLDEIADTILPTTTSPGAKAAEVGHFMAVMVRDCYTTEDQNTFIDGMTRLDDASQKQHNGKFMTLTPAQRTDILNALDKEQMEFTKQRNIKLDADKLKHPNDPNYEAPDLPKHYFRMMKELTLLGYFTSEIGATKALRYVAVPGRFDGCIPYKKGDKAWATS